MFYGPNNKQVTSSLIAAPLGGGEAVVRQCREQGVVMIASGASLGGFAGEEWLARSDPGAGLGEVDGTASLGLQQQQVRTQLLNASSGDAAPYAPLRERGRGDTRGHGWLVQKAAEAKTS